MNAVTWAGAFVVINILGNLNHKELILPAIVAIVGLHMFFMPPAFRHQVNLVAGGSMTAWAILSVLLYRGNTIAGLVTLGAGVILWVAAAYAIRTASGSLHLLGL